LYLSEEVVQLVAWGAAWRDIVPGSPSEAELRARYCGPAARSAAGSLSDDGCDDDYDDDCCDCL
jgi:hypothetical protein